MTDEARTPVGSVTEVWRYPVKSMQGERMDRAELAGGQIVHDRGWGVIDTESQKLLSAKRLPELLMASARAEPDGVATITLPDGTTVDSGDRSVDEVLSGWLGRPVELARPDPAATRRIEIEVDDGAPEPPAPLPVFEFSTRPGRFFDSSSTLHLVSTATLDRLRADPRRLRPNVVVELADDEPFAEDSWIGDTIVIGGVPALAHKRTERCVVTTRAQPGLGADRSLLRTVVRSHDLCAGIYLRPAEQGGFGVGDAVWL